VLRDNEVDTNNAVRNFVVFKKAQKKMNNGGARSRSA
jgi:hypothetical protein